MLRYYKLYEPHFGKDELNAVAEVLKSGILTQGPKVAELETKFADYVGSKYAVAVNSCTSAIFLCLKYETIVNNLRKITIPSVTFVSVANMIFHAGLQLNFCDEIYVGDWYYLKGTSIIDSAHYLQRFCYVPDSLMCFSFYPTKLLASAEGGMIATDNKKVYEWLRKARANGMERKGMFDWDYSVEFAGWKMVMNDIQAAIALVRLKKLDIYNKTRETIRDFYNKEFKLDNKSLHVYPIMVENRDKFIKGMAKKKIQTSVHFKPIHWQPAYKNWQKTLLPLSDEWGKKSVSIPLHENMDLIMAKKISEEIKKWRQ
jgi:dTDP-4-amino-4,6-dideoxygalactose transaminase